MNNKENKSLKREINWLKVLFQLQVNTSALFAFGYILRYGCMWKTLFFALFLVILGLLGQTAGAHRLWAHGSFKATKSLKVFLMLCQTLTGHGSVYDWVLWHRLHHKYFGTELDPYNPKKGFFYSHMLSSIRNLSPAQIDAMKEVDTTDLKNDSVIMFQKKWYGLLFALVVLLLPINAPGEYWGESLISSFFVVGWLRYALGLHFCWLIHSATTIWGLKPGEKYPADTNLVFLITKTYWLSYHYLAPWDYQASEYGKYGIDCVSKFIRVCAALEYAGDLKTIDSQSVRTALTASVIENKDISYCLHKLAADDDVLPKDYLLVPKKYSSNEKIIE